MRVTLVLFILGLMATAAAAGDLFSAIAAGDKAAVKQALANGAGVNSRAPDQATPLIAAGLKEDAIIAELLVNSGADVMARNSGGFTALHAAAFSGSVPIAKLLLEKGAVLEDDRNKAGVSPLMIAGEENHLELAEFFIARGADLKHAELHGYMPITRAFWKGNVEIIKLYRRHGVTCQGADILGSEAEVTRCMNIHD
jgi:ankyrin repeat protein